jgi:hypothetical protein
MYIALGFLIAALTISLTSVGAKVSAEIGRVLIANDFKNPIPIVSKDDLKVRGEVKIDGEPKVKLDGDTKIKIESIDKTVKVRFDRAETMPEAGIFKTGKRYLLKPVSEVQRTCSVDKINDTWIFCEEKLLEGEIVGWVNTAQLTFVFELSK